MDALTLTQTLLADAACPVCDRKSLDVRLHGGPGRTAAPYLATCTGCGHAFEVERTEPETAPGRPCERCPDGVLEPVLRCHALSGRREVAWVCRQCEGAAAALLLA